MCWDSDKNNTECLSRHDVCIGVLEQEYCARCTVQKQG